MDLCRLKFAVYSDEVTAITPGDATDRTATTPIPGLFLVARHAGTARPVVFTLRRRSDQDFGVRASYDRKNGSGREQTSIRLRGDAPETEVSGATPWFVYRGEEHAEGVAEAFANLLESARTPYDTRRSTYSLDDRAARLHAAELGRIPLWTVLKDFGIGDDW